MTLQGFLQAVEAIRASKPRYRLGGKGNDGTCDCIGLIIGAVERCGVKWSGVHGSNWWARHYAAGLERVTKASVLTLGDLVLKARSPGEAGYDLPDRYDDDADRLDYYHAGVVTGIAPLAITHCTSGGGADGVVVDTQLGRWSHRGRLSLVEDTVQEKEDNGMMATVWAENGKPVNLRRKPSTSGAQIMRVPVGQVVTVLSRAEGWAQINCNGETGYMMEQFLRFAQEQESLPDGAELLSRLEALEERVLALEGGVG